ncbi:MAG: N-acetyl-gamma-glutamyl-phosphate reductase [Haliscomenobacter sp.]|nr:N-acetyl-gamma-glutamyl-phosphate reductase [Haliscomenobacter sp.]MBK8655699.1 N-acetyl-gamma-glutamyl-phosphate reductase [Haliscomenobacter sp.]MBP9077123.1 N-acetyl-gamma-glutamyl-phosphate reductase [Haliscomenobacter sp.]MBP9872723.1 N-acetyl-gamma-glutamyl-phosphate reductase [Haliscomenobacter sp.]
MIKAGIVGGAGYTGGELLRILLRHPQATIAFVHSNSQAGLPVWQVHEDLEGETDLHFSASIHMEVDVLFLCVAHGQARAFLAEQPVPDHVAVIDLSQDFRLDSRFVYGLPELNRESIRQSKRIANCGCFATAIQLGLLPLAHAGLLRDEVHIHAITGSTGAGQALSPTSHFSWRANNLQVYKPFEHQHLKEISQSLHQLQPDFDQALNFIPVRGDFTRGILASMYTACDLPEDEAVRLYESYYEDAPFTVVSRRNPNLKQVVNTNKCLIHVEKHGNKLFIVSLIDNLVKGASGQAVQNMNLIFGLEETAGLQLKPAGF